MEQTSGQEALIVRLAEIAKTSSRSDPDKTFYGDPLPADAMLEAADRRERTPGHIALRTTIELQSYDPPL